MRLRDGMPTSWPTAATMQTGASKPGFSRLKASFEAVTNAPAAS